MWLLPQLRGGACFCTRDAMQDYDVDLNIVALAKTVTPGGSPRRQPGQAAPLTTKRSSLARKFSRCGKGNAIYRPVIASAINFLFCCCFCILSINEFSILIYKMIQVQNQSFKEF